MKEPKNILPKLKLWLLQGKKITAFQAWMKFGTSRLSSYIHRLRHEHGMKEIQTDNTPGYGVYFIPKKEKVNRITSRKYLQQCDYKR